MFALNVEPFVSQSIVPMICCFLLHTLAVCGFGRRRSFSSSAMNAVSSTVVEKTLVDDVIWYRSGISAIQQENSKELLISQLANKIKDEFNSVSDSTRILPFD